jgi:hypothetical protein
MQGAIGAKTGSFRLDDHMTGDPAFIKTADGMGDSFGYLAPKGFTNIKVFS